MASGSPLPGLIMFGIVAAAVGGSAYAAYVGNKKRNLALQAVAQAMGFSFQEPCDLAAVDALVGETPLFKRGHARKAQRMLRGRLADRDAAIFDYRYTTGSGKSSHTHLQTVVLFPGGAAGLPDFDLSPEGMFHAVAELFGAQDIDFEQNAEFSKRYLLRGQDEAAIRRAFTTDALAWFGGAPGWRVQSHQNLLAVFREGKFVAPAEIPSYAAEALRIVGVFGRA